MQEISNNSAFKGYKEGMKVALALGLGAVVWSVFKVTAHTQRPNGTVVLLANWISCFNIAFGNNGPDFS